MYCIDCFTNCCHILILGNFRDWQKATTGSGTGTFEQQCGETDADITGGSHCTTRWLRIMLISLQMFLLASGMIFPRIVSMS